MQKWPKMNYISRNKYCPKLNNYLILNHFFRFRYFAREYNSAARHILSHSHHPKHGYFIWSKNIVNFTQIKEDHDLLRIVTHVMKSYKQFKIVISVFILQCNHKVQLSGKILIMLSLETFGKFYFKRSKGRGELEFNCWIFYRTPNRA